MKNDTLFYGNKPSFYRKRHVVLWKTSRCFMKNDTSFYEKQAVICIVC